MSPEQEALLRSRVRSIADFPAPGVVFRDLSPLFADPEAFAVAIELLAPAATGVDLLLAVEARGFVLAAPLALRVGVGMSMVRKPGKLFLSTRVLTY